MTPDQPDETNLTNTGSLTEPTEPSVAAPAADFVGPAAGRDNTETSVVSGALAPIVDDSVETTNDQPFQPPKRSKKWLFIALILTSLILAGGAFAAIKLHYRLTIAKATTSSSAKPGVSKVSPVIQSVPQFSNNFLASDQPLTGTPTLFSNYKELFGTDCSATPDTADVTSCPALLKASDFVYRTIGSTKSGQPIIVVNNGQMGEMQESFMALQTSANKYSILGRYSGRFYSGTDGALSNSSIDAFKKNLDPNTTLDMTTSIDDLNFTGSFGIKKAEFSLSFDRMVPELTGYPFTGGLKSIRGDFYGPIDTAKIVKLGDYGAKTIYQVKARDAANYSVNEIYMTVNAVYGARYRLNDDVATIKIPTITWLDGTNNKATYTYSAQGCGSADGYITAKNLSASQLTKVGSSPEGRSLYQLPTSSALFQEIYNVDYGSGSSLADASLQNLTAAQLQAHHVVIVAQNGLGEYVVYKDSNYFGGGGCAKPVVYLYPTTPQAVNVSVGAKVSMSEPAYGARGWTNVQAQPNGRLSYQGKQYSNLFWEGLGIGEYPVVDAGTIVSRAEAIPAIRHQLSQQGLNPAETQDFINYWGPKLPATKYVRLTWFSTADINDLAPLHISPTPNTVIRVFLDFQGLNRTYALQPQQLSGPARQGFTVIEWGGLDRSNNLSQISN